MIIADNYHTENLTKTKLPKTNPNLTQTLNLTNLTVTVTHKPLTLNCIKL